MEIPVEETVDLNEELTISAWTSSQQKFSLRKQMLWSLIPAIIFPLSIAAILASNSIESNRENTITKQLSQETHLIQKVFKNSLERTSLTSSSFSDDRIILEAINLSTEYLKNTEFFPSQKIQIIDTQQNQAIQTIGQQEITNNSMIVGGNPIAKIGTIVQKATGNSLNNSAAILDSLPPEINRQRVAIDFSTNERISSQSQFAPVTISFPYQNREYRLTSIPQTDLIVAASIDRSEITIVSDRFLWQCFIAIAITCAISAVIILLLEDRLANSLKHLTFQIREATLGNFDVRIKPTGTRETSYLAESLNDLLTRISQFLAQREQIIQDAENTLQNTEHLAAEQKEKNARIQQELLELLSDVEGASSGDLTVRSRINDGEIGIVADFFNSIIESLRDIVAQVKQTAQQVNVSVGENQKNISELAKDASQQADRIARTLASVAEITQSIQQIARNAQEAAKVAHIASNKAELGGQSMELTVDSIRQLQSTIDRTAEKVKTLGEASQKISRVISLIDRIAIQTNLLSINASIEAARAGEEGKGFAVVAEEVGELASQSSDATKEVATIIVAIQQEIAQVVEAMEIGIVQAEEGTHLVEQTKGSLEQIVTVSYQIDRLVQSISDTTVSQAETSQNVTQLMEQIAIISAKTSDFSQNTSVSLESTVAIAQKLQSSVDAFKVEREE